MPLALLGGGKYLTHAVVTTDCGKISYIGDKIPENNGKYRVIDCRSGLLMPGFCEYTLPFPDDFVPRNRRRSSAPALA